MHRPYVRDVVDLGTFGERATEERHVLLWNGFEMTLATFYHVAYGVGRTSVMKKM